MTAADLPPFPEIPLSPESRLRWLAWGRECMAIERERCAKIAENERDEFMPQAANNNGSRESDFAFGSVNSAERIRDAIRFELPRNQEG